ncbi:MAG TPA: hypothetical protein VFG30_14205 [Polyangiales bacterium]|nr:hypothetical protein [Polyangiales bacterium]
MRIRTVAAVASGLLVSLSAACNSLDKPGVDGDSKVVIPTDTRGVSEALHTLPAISGGTLKLTDDDAFALVSDPDRDRISIVSLGTTVGVPAAASTVRHITLEPGDEPGRIDYASGRAYVALRGSGELLVLDVASASVLARTAICSAPRGLKVEAGSGMVHVACAEGRLVSLNLAGDEIVRDVRLDGDLRDVLVTAEGLRVTTFKTSQLLTIDPNGLEIGRTGPEDFNLTIEKDDPTADSAGSDGLIASALALRPMKSHIAWRAVEVQGSVMMLHQASATEEVDIKKARKIENGAVSSPYGGGGSSGAALGCQGVVVTSLSSFGADGPQRTVALEGGVLDVDLAVSVNRDEIAVVEAGTLDAEAPIPEVVSASGDETSFSSQGIGRFSDGTSIATPASGEQFKSESRVMKMSLAGFAAGSNVPTPNTRTAGVGSFMGCNFPRETIDVPGQATALAYTSSGILIVQSREPALLTVLAPTGVMNVIDLHGDSVRDTGHDLFHRNSGGGIACASCHAEGAEDGHVWNFKGQGLRRTQALHVGLKGTAPFHWAGDETDLTALMEDVFVGRMGGVHQSDARVTALTKFLFALEPPRAGKDLGDPAAMRGKALFESAATGCTNCHTGNKFTDNKSYDVGTSQGELLQVPSLRGVGYRAPFIHTGCAHTLRDRFDPTCGGSKHGNTAALGTPQVDDLVSYLQTL